MPDNNDNVTSRMNAIATIIIAITGLVGLFVGGPKIKEMWNEGDEQIEQAPIEEDKSDRDLIIDEKDTPSVVKGGRTEEESTEEPIKEEPEPNGMQNDDEVASTPIQNETEESVTFEIIRKGFQLKETRYITFDNEKFRLSFQDINSARKTAVAVIKNNNGEEITSDTLAEGDFFRFEINTTFYEVHLYGIKNRTFSLNLAYFDIYKEK